MLSFRSILVAAATFATIVSAVPTPEIIPDLIHNPSIPVFGMTTSFPGLGGLPIGEKGITQSKRGGAPSCYERIKKCHDDIAVIVVKIG